MTRILQLQCDTGISGDMVVGALIDLGASAEGLVQALKSLKLDGFEVRITQKSAGALAGCDFDVVVDDEHENHDHDMEWLFGGMDDSHEAHHHDHDHEHDHHHHHGHGHHHDHEHDHHHGHGHDHAHRNLADIKTIIEGSALSRNAKKTALRIFTIIAEAEAKAHGETIDTVHFHEVGAVDSIVDVAAVAWCLDDLGVDEAVVSALAEGEGHVRCAHGVLPIPVPAVANIVEAYELVIKRAHRHAELITPTGAAIAAAIGSMPELPEQYRLIGSGIGTGKRAYTPPSMVRALLVEDSEHPADALEPSQPPIWKLETEVDDCTGEALGFVLDLLFEAGAREAHFVPVYMKKSRPGYQIEVLCDEEKVAELEGLLFKHTTTIGIRRYPVQRTVLDRELCEVPSPFGSLRAKHVTLPDGTQRVYPEHDCVAAVAKEKGVSYQDVFRSI